MTNKNEMLTRKVSLGQSQTNWEILKLLSLNGFSKIFRCKNRKGHVNFLKVVSVTFLLVCFQV